MEFNPACLNTAVPLFRRCEALCNNRQWAEAEPFAKHALAVLEAEAPKHLLHADTLRLLVLIYRRQGRGVEAVVLAEKALAIYTHNYGRTSPELARKTAELQTLGFQGP